jgi:hypothetical protein
MTSPTDAPRSTLRAVSRAIGLLVVLGTGHLLAPTAAAQEAPPPPQPAPEASEPTERPRPYQLTPSLEALANSGEIQTAMRKMGSLSLDETARRADQTLIEDGPCRAVFEDGIIVPVNNGGGAVPDRAVGFVFFGNGRLEVDFEDRADATTFANHMVTRAGVEPSEVAHIAHGEGRYESRFSRAIVLTADTQMADVLSRLTPVGTGTVFNDTRASKEDDILMELVVTDSKGELKARALARNILPQRIQALSGSGYDPVDMLRYDRMLHDLLGTPWRDLRMVSEFQTDDRFFVADRTKLGNPKTDRWLTCFRDGLDHRAMGLYSQVFVHGKDGNNNIQHVSFGGERFKPRPSDGAQAPIQRIAAKDAQVKVEVTPKKRMMYVHATVESTLTLEALDDGTQHVVLRLPADEAVQNKFKLNKLELKDGTPLELIEVDARMGRAASMASRSGSLQNQLDGQSVSASIGGGDGGGAGSVNTFGSGSGNRDGGSGDDGSDALGTGITSTENTQGMGNETLSTPNGVAIELLVPFPKPLKKGETIELQLDWEADWVSSEFAVIRDQMTQGGSASQYRNLGVSTGAKRFLPDLLPDPGSTAWTFDIKVGAPARRMDVAISGETREEVTDESGWLWQHSRGRDMRSPAVNVGKYNLFEEEPYPGLPSLRVFMQRGYQSYGDMFGPEARRVMVYLRRFMPLPDIDELDVVQGKSQVKEDTYRRARGRAAAGMISFNTIQAGATVGASSELDTENPFRAEYQLAQQMTTQLWGQSIVPAGARDDWMIRAISETFGMLYVRSAKKEEGLAAFEGRLNYVRDDIEKTVDATTNSTDLTRKDTFLSLTNRGSFTYNREKMFSDYAFYVFARMLRERVGDQAYFRAIDRFSTRSKGKLVTTDDLQAELEQTSGQDLEDFFTYWIRGGFIPNVDVEYTLTPDGDGTVTVDGCVKTDVPFGTFDLPIAVWDDRAAKREDDKAERKGKLDIDRKGVGGMITVVDGRGQFKVKGRPETAIVETDPYGLIIAWSRKSSPVKQLDCTPAHAEDFGQTDEANKRRTREAELDYDREGAESEGADK